MCVRTRAGVWSNHILATHSATQKRAAQDAARERTRKRAMEAVVLKVVLPANAKSITLELPPAYTTRDLYSHVRKHVFDGSDVPAAFTLHHGLANELIPAEGEQTLQVGMITLTQPLLPLPVVRRSVAPRRTLRMAHHSTVLHSMT